MRPTHPNRQLWTKVSLLAGCQALSFSTMTLVVAIGGILGSQLAEIEEFATLPISAMLIGTMTMVFPASAIMKRIGRRAGFALGNLLGLSGGAFLSVAVYHASFWLFIAGTFLVGNLIGFAQFYRLAAVDSTPVEHRPQAISMVLAGGVAAGFLGPAMARASRIMTPELPFLWAGAWVMGACLMSMILLAFLRLPAPDSGTQTGQSRSLKVLLRQSRLRLAVLIGLSGFMLMTFLMNAGPLAIVRQGHSFVHSAQAVQWHIVAMFFPSFFTGFLIARFGIAKIVIAGFLMFSLAITTALLGTDYPFFLTSLILLGLAWNLTYVGSSTLLTQTYDTAGERSKVQGFNELTLALGNVLASFSAGLIFVRLGWNGVNYLAIGLFVLALLTALFFLKSAIRPRAPERTPIRQQE